MTETLKTTKISLEFNLTSEEQLHLFTQWREEHPDFNLENMTSRKYLSTIKEVLAAKGWQAVNARLPLEVEIKKLDYRSILKGIVPN